MIWRVSMNVQAVLCLTLVCLHCAISPLWLKGRYFRVWWHYMKSLYIWSGKSLKRPVYHLILIAYNIGGHLNKRLVHRQNNNNNNLFCPRGEIWEYWSFRHFAFSPHQPFFDIFRSVLIIAAKWMCTILRYCGIIAMLQYKEKGPECTTCKHVAKMCLCVSVFTELQSIISIQVCNCLTRLRLTCHDPTLYCVAPDLGCKNTINESKWTQKCEKYC